jgi:hypothetical protein
MTQEEFKSIQLLASLGVNVIHFNHLYFAYSEFIPADDDINENSLLGKRIDDVINELGRQPINVDVVAQGNIFLDAKIGSILQKIDQLPIMRVKFSKNITWVSYHAQ